MSYNEEVAAEDVHKILSKHMLAPGYDIVLDLEKSKGLSIVDAKTGDNYLDFFSFFASNPLGMNHPKLATDEFTQKIGKIALHKPSNSDIYTEQMAEFVQTFARVGIPDYLPHSFYISGGALAVENALKVAFDWKVKKNFQKGYREEKGHKVLHLEHAFHGRTGYTMSLTNTAQVKTKYFSKFNWPRIKAPIMHYPATDEHIQQTVQDENLAIAQAERYFEKYKDDIACIILEPIQGEGGDNHFRLEFHKALRKLADKHEALLIYDEVQTGVGLTGKFWAHEHFVKPDMIAFGKKTQVCGILVSKRIDDVENNCFEVPSRLNSTWGGNLVDMVRFSRILKIIEEDNLVENAAKVGKHLQKNISDLAEECEHISNPRGKGLYCAIDLPDAHARDAVVDACMDNNLIILGCGGQTIRFRPPLTVEKDHVDKAVEILEKSYKEAEINCPAIS